MWFRILIVISGIFSFIYFISPASFKKLNLKDKDVLGITSANAAINKGQVETALMLYCIDKSDLPNDLNALYGDYLDQKTKINLNQLYNYKIEEKETCDYLLKAL